MERRLSGDFGSGARRKARGAFCPLAGVTPLASGNNAPCATPESPRRACSLSARLWASSSPMWPAACACHNCRDSESTCFGCTPSIAQASALINISKAPHRAAVIRQSTSDPRKMIFEVDAGYESMGVFALRFCSPELSALLFPAVGPSLYRTSAAVKSPLRIGQRFPANEQESPICLSPASR